MFFNADINIFVDRGADYHTRSVSVESFQIRAAADKAYSQWRF